MLNLKQTFYRSAAACDPNRINLRENGSNGSEILGKSAPYRERCRKRPIQFADIIGRKPDVVSLQPANSAEQSLHLAMGELIAFAQSMGFEAILKSVKSNISLDIEAPLTGDIEF